MKAIAWAVLDAEDEVLAVRVTRDAALLYVEFSSGNRIAPLALAALDDVDEASAP